MSTLTKIKIDGVEYDLPSGGGGGGGTTNYNDLSNKPKINNVELNGNKTLSDLGINNFSGSYNDLINKPNIPTKTSDLENDSNYITGITSSDVTSALGYTPYNSTNPNGYTSNVGTITGITMNGSSKGTSGVVNLGTVITSHQDISGKQDKITTTNKLDYSLLSNTPTIPSEVTQSTVSGWGFTKNTGTITGIKMNGSSKGTSGVVDLGTVITSHQDISGKANISDLAEVATSGEYKDLINKAVNEIKASNTTTPISMYLDAIKQGTTVVTKDSSVLGKISIIPCHEGEIDLRERIPMEFPIGTIFQNKLSSFVDRMMSLPLNTFLDGLVAKTPDGKVYSPYLDENENAIWKEREVENSGGGDTLPIGTIVDYNGTTVPDGYEQVDDPNSYSTNEVEIGTWIDGSKIYRKTIIINSVGTAGTWTLDTGVKFGVLVNLYGSFLRDSDHNFFPVNAPRTTITSIIATTTGYDTSTQHNTLYFDVGSDRSNLHGWVIIEYTKSN